MIDYNIFQFQTDINILVEKIFADQRNYKYDNLYGVPRGGIHVATALSYATGIPQIDHIVPNQKILIVDDILDSGKTREKYKDYDFACLHIKPHHSEFRNVYYVSEINDWVNYWWEKQDNHQETIEDNIVRIMELIGENPNRAGLIDTPKRVAKMYREFFCGYDKAKKPRIMTVDNGEDGVHYDQMLIDQGYFFSFCEHHIIPFFGQYYYGYIPDKKILGASKIGRIIDYYAGKLQIAERLVNEVVNEFEEAVHPIGQVLVMNARHLCKEMRGLKKWNSPFEAIAVRGTFASNTNGCKDEFMARINKGN